jgi:hypothetical protein
MTFHLSAVARDGAIAIGPSIRTAASVDEATKRLATLATLYPPAAHLLGVITAFRCWEEERVDLRMAAAGRCLQVKVI